MKGGVPIGLQRYKTLILVLTIALALFIASPSLQQLLVLPQTESLSELWLFGSFHNATYPSNVTVGENYRLYLGVSNHLGSCSYYVVEVKFRNQTQSAPDSFNHTNSRLPSMGSLTIIVANNKSLEVPLDVSFQYRFNEKNSSLLEMEYIALNGANLSANATTVAWDPQKGGFYGNLFFELWVYNQSTDALEYHERYVSLWLKLET